MTIHRGQEKTYAVLVNYSERPQEPKLTLREDTVLHVIYGSADVIEPYDAAIFEIAAGN